ncbi:MAG: PAS-domain containing protein [Pseudomonadota bacterium]
MADAVAMLRALAEALDGVDIAACVFDQDDASLLWNRSFLKLFPEHAPYIYVGEAYASNLRRFYGGRLSQDELPRLERYVEEGVARHRAQQRPFRFEHNGVHLTVSSAPLEGIGSIRMWRAESVPVSTPALPLLPITTGEAMAIADSAWFDHVAEGVMVTGAAQAITWVNQAFVRMYGLSERPAVNGLKFEDVYRLAWIGAAVSEQPLFERGLAVLNENLRFSGAPFEVPLPGARWARVTEQRGPEGQGFFAHVDITMLKRQQQQLQLAERRARESEALLKQKSLLLETTLDRMEQGLMMVNADRVVEVCNRRAIELLELPRALMESRPTFNEVLAWQWAHDEFAEVPDDIQQFVRAGGILDQPHCYDRKRPDGRVIEVQSVPIQGGGIVRTYEDITERRRNEERIRHLARHDGLTSLVNRGVFLEQLAEAVRSARRRGGAFAVHFIDIDEFKPVNDRYGHAVGDKVLALIAHRMRQVVGEGDVVARMGGDEFAILQAGAGGADSACALAQRILDSLRQPMQIETFHLQLGASLGVALFPTGGDEADLLLRNADAAMYIAKATGSGSPRIYGEPASGTGAAAA